MLKAILLSAVMVSIMNVGTAQVAVAGSNHVCPANSTSLLDPETGVWVCKHATVNLVDGHPAYDEKAVCTPGETREFKVPLKSGGFRVVRQRCNANYVGPEGDHAPKHLVTGY